MNKVQDSTAPEWNALSPQQHHPHHPGTRIGGSGNELKPPMPENFGSDEERRRVSKISTGPMGQ